MESVEAMQATQQEQHQQKKEKAVATNDATDKKKDDVGNVLVEEVSLVEEEVKISAVVDSVASEVVEETSSSVVETTSELQPLAKVSLDELSSLIDFDASKGVADETNEEKAVSPITSVTTTTVDAGETKDITVVADAENDTSPANTSTSIDTAVTDKVAKQENTKEKEAKELAAKAKENKLNDASDIMQGEKDASIKDSDDAAAANRAPDHAVVSPTEPMDIDEPVNASANKKKKSAKEPARNGKKRKGKKPVIPQESEDKEDGEEIDEEMPEYEVENIAGHRVFKGKVVKYVVKWKGYPSSENTIENAITMHDDVPELCAAYWAACKEKIPDNVPQVATEELKPNLKEQQQKDREKDDANNDTDESEDDTYKPETKARSPSPVAATLPTASIKDTADAASPSEDESQAQSRRNTPAPSSFTPSATSPSSDSIDVHATNTSPKRPIQPLPNKRKRAASSSIPEPTHTKKYKKNMEHIPDYMVKLGYQFPTHWPNKKTEWDVDVKKVCVQASPVDNKVRFTYLEWNNGEKTIHPMKEAHEMIPEKLIQYYEERLHFV